MHRSFVTPVGTTGRHHTSCPCAGSVNGLVFDNDVRRAELVRESPLIGIGERGRRRNVGRIAVRRAVVDPASNRLNLLLAQTEIVLEFLNADLRSYRYGGISPATPSA